MELWKLKSIFNRKNRFLTLNEIYEEFSLSFDVLGYEDFKAAIRTEIYRNCVYRNLNIKGNKLFVSLKAKGERGQQYGLYEWVYQGNLTDTKDMIEFIEKSPAIYLQKSISKVLRSEFAKEKALERAEYLCENNKNHKSFKRKKDGRNYVEAHHLIPLEAQFFSKYKDINLDCPENIVSLCSHCHNEIHYGVEFESILLKLYQERKSILERKGIYISFDELKMYYE